jgi:hypothetical protein
VIDDVTSLDQVYALMPMLIRSGSYSISVTNHSSDSANHEKTNDNNSNSASPSLSSSTNSLPPLSHSGRVNSNKSSLRKSVNLATNSLKNSTNLAASSSPSIPLSPPTSTLARSSSALSPSPSTPLRNSTSASTGKNLVIVVSNEELALHESKTVSVVKVPFN